MPGLTLPASSYRMLYPKSCRMIDCCTLKPAGWLIRATRPLLTAILLRLSDGSVSESSRMAFSAVERGSPLYRTGLSEPNRSLDGRASPCILHTIIEAAYLCEPQTTVDGDHLSGDPFRCRISDLHDSTGDIIRVSAPLEGCPFALPHFNCRRFFRSAPWHPVWQSPRPLLGRCQSFRPSR